jgi:hypothetical protein
MRTTLRAGLREFASPGSRWRSASAVSVLVIDCTTTGAPPPTGRRCRPSAPRPDACVAARHGLERERLPTHGDCRLGCVADDHPQGQWAVWLVRVSRLHDLREQDLASRVRDFNPGHPVEPQRERSSELVACARLRGRIDRGRPAGLHLVISAWRWSGSRSRFGTRRRGRLLGAGGLPWGRRVCLGRLPRGVPTDKAKRDQAGKSQTQHEQAGRLLLSGRLDG